MVTLSDRGAFVLQGRLVIEEADRLSPDQINQRLAKAGLAPLAGPAPDSKQARTGTMAYRILAGHNESQDERQLKIRFDSLASHDITYVGIIQTARAGGGLTEFPVPYVLTNCHNSLCAVGGTINADDHLFGLSAARKYGGIFVPAHQAVIHQYLREMMAGGGRMILASDSHTRYGALGTMGIGEGGPEIAKQLLKKPYELTSPEVIAVYLKGRPAPGVGPQDVALALIGAVFPNGYVKNKVLEFIGPGIACLPIDYRNGIDTMTTESACLSSIWETDEQVEGWYKTHGRPEDYRRLAPAEVAWYDGVVTVDLDRVEPMIALPFHPSNVWPIAELNRNGRDILHQVEVETKKQIENPNLALHLTDKLVNGRLKADQGSVSGCAGGTFANIVAMAGMMDGKSIGDGAFALTVFPASQPVYLELIRNGSIAKLVDAGTVIRTAFCGPCFGATETPINNGFSIRHATRNFPNREGSKPANDQLASVGLMDARSIAATALNGGLLTPATELGLTEEATAPYRFDPQVYARRVYQGFGQAHPEEGLCFGPNIADWPRMQPLPENLLLKVTALIRDPVTTTDELIPSGETSSYRSNPLKMAEFTLSRKDPAYVGRAKAFQALENRRLAILAQGGPTEDLEAALADFWPGGKPTPEELARFIRETGLGSVIFAVKPGDGSAREQAASCQKVLGGQANIAVEYATKRYRSNLINWGMLPFIVGKEDAERLRLDDLLYVPGIRRAVSGGVETISAFLIRRGERTPLELKLEGLSPDDREILLAGCLINYYAR
ncbi:MAG: hydratase [Deltaproteobacteria bacterium]|nr:hydratase [Deltaproteobacteria bacterium]